MELLPTPTAEELSDYRAIFRAYQIMTPYVVDVTTRRAAAILGEWLERPHADATEIQTILGDLRRASSSYLHRAGECTLDEAKGDLFVQYHLAGCLAGLAASIVTRREVPLHREGERHGARDMILGARMALEKGAPPPRSVWRTRPEDADYREWSAKLGL